MSKQPIQNDSVLDDTQIDLEDLNEVFNKYTQELPDGSRQVILSDNTVVILRRLKGGDITHINQSGDEGILQTMRLICLVCVKWGTEKGITLPQLKEIDIADIELLSKVIASFRTRRRT